MAKNYWLAKQEPGTYSWETFVQEGGTSWTGVRNFQARKHLRAMKQGDSVLFYHSGEERAVVGIAEVAKEPYPDPTAEEGDWSTVDLVPVKPLPHPVSLVDMKADTVLKGMPVVRQSRLSVSPVTAQQFRRVLELAKKRS
jgi:predicted RNA-binding protein with PUA-like domain